jgi:capsid assembly protease
MPAHQTPHQRILAAIQSELWAITPEALQQVIAVAQGLNDAPEAVAAKLGRPLDNTRTVTRRGDVAVVPVTGPIFRYANLFTQISGATSIQQLGTDFAAAVADPTIRGIVLEIDSPGGQVAGVSEFAQMVRAATEQKPVVAYVSHLGASAGYWIPAAAASIVVADTAILGSIGVVMRAQLGKNANDIEIVSSQSPDKRVDPATEHGLAKIQALVDAQAQVFIDAVAEYRGMSIEQVTATQGGLLVGAAAVTSGLADRVGSLEGVIAELNRKPNTNRGFSMPSSADTNPAITRELIAADYPAIANAFRDEGFAEGQKVGAEQERDRIQSVEAQCLPGHEGLIGRLKFDGKTTGPEAAVQVLAAESEKLAAMSKQLKAEAPTAQPHAEAPMGNQPAQSPPHVLSTSAIYAQRANSAR